MRPPLAAFFNAFNRVSYARETESDELMSQAIDDFLPT